jgi:hypothetical protein
MARIRSLKPEFWLDPKITRLSRDARMLYMALWNMADEHGRLLGDPRVIKGQCFPYDDDLTPDRIDTLICELEGHRKAVRYESDDAIYLHLPNLSKHQRLEPEKVPSRLPSPPTQAPDLHTPDGDDSSERRADESAPRADELSLLQVAGSREQVAGSKDANRNRNGVANDDAFDEFWQMYPRRKDRLHAKKAWGRAVREAGGPTPIIDGLRSQLPNLGASDPKFVPYAATWLNGGRWEDEVEATATARDEPLPSYWTNDVTGLGTRRD